MKFSIYKVYENNILFYLKRGKDYESFYGQSGDEGDKSDNSGDEEGGDDDEIYHSVDDYTANPDYGDVIATRELQYLHCPAQRAE